MEMKQNPFSLYDFLGYFVPGALFLFGLASIPYLSNPPETILDDSIRLLRLNQPGVYFPFILIAYLVGHLVSFVSSVTLENYSRWKFGYPSKFLLGVPSRGYWKTDEDEDVSRKIIIRLLVAIFLLPVTIWDYFLGDTLNLKNLLVARKIDSSLINTINGKMKKLASHYVGIKGKNNHLHESGIFRFAYHFASEKSPVHYPKMQNYVALYGFTRTITLVIVIWFWLILFSPNIYHIAIHYIPIFPVAISMIAYISFLNFMKFYRRFSLEVFMAISVII